MYEQDASPRGTSPTPDPTALTSVEVARLVFKTASLRGVDTHQLAADAGVRPWVLSAGTRMIPTRLTAQLLESLANALADPQAGLTVARQHALRDFGLYDYLISTSATLRDGMSAASRYLHLLATSGRLEVAADTGPFTTYTCRSTGTGDRCGEELCLQFAVGMLCTGARAAAGRQVVPVRVTLPQQAPRSTAAFAEALGTTHIDFGAPAATLTFSAADLDLPLPMADQELAEILARYADAFPAPLPVTWYERFQRLLDGALDASSPSLAEVARQLAMSARTLQRRLAERGTTWRAEVDAARRRRAENAILDGEPNATRLARHLGYADPRSARRAVRRWGGRGPAT
jgi:AraC-like DNA-binding protein